MRLNADPEPRPVTSGRTLDHAAEVYDWLAPLMTFGVEDACGQVALSRLALRGGEQILDVGCGTGKLTRRLAAAAASAPGSLVVGLDAAPRMIAVARRKAVGIPTIRFDVGVAESLSYADGSFDAAVSTFFFHHINYDLKRRSLSELRRVLRPGARLIVVDVDTPTTVFGRLCAHAGAWLFQQDEIRENIRGQLRTAMAAAGFQSVRPVAHRLGYITVFELVRGLR
jgi:ubiquinone/menaquinone biosynthesis C-methylase UbiE